MDILHRVGVKTSSPDAVYDALTTVDGLAGWWTDDTSGDADVGGVLEFRFIPGGFDIEVLDLVPSKHVGWQVIEGPEEWIGTDVTFNLSQQGETTILLFGHRNWREAVEFTAHCSMKWATFLLSLRQLVETGTGQPAPDDLKIDNWN